MRTTKDERIRLFTDISVEEVRALSRSEPHKTFYVYAVPCPGCHRHIVAMGCSIDEKPKKYVVATIANGVVIGRTTRRH